MSKPNASRTLPPGDRDESLPLVDPSILTTDEPTHPGAGRKPTTELPPAIADKVRMIAGLIDEAQFALGDLKLAVAQGDAALADAAGWRLQEAFGLVDLRTITRELRLAASEALRENIRAEVSPAKREIAA